MKKYGRILEVTKDEETTGNRVKFLSEYKDKTIPVYTEEEDYELNQFIFEMKEKFNITDEYLSKLDLLIDNLTQRKFEDGYNEHKKSTYGTNN